MNAFLIGGTSSGSGKTTLTLGLLHAFRRKGLSVQPFKVGPDYIDTAWHSRVAGTSSRNLDEFMLPQAMLLNTFYQRVAQVDVAIIEGVMGLYDGYGIDPHYCSSAGMAKKLACPVILVIDGKAVSTSAAATVLGFQQFDPSLNIAGVILNQVNSDGHFDLLKTAIERYTDIPVIGRLPHLKAIELPSRHLGLITAHEQANYDDAWDQLADQIEQHLDLDLLLQLSALPPVPVPDDTLAQALKGQGNGLTLAMAYDDAFNFYYQDNLDLLAASGVRVVRFSPLQDEILPDADLIYIGGGFPELYAEQLSANQPMLAALKRAHEQGVAIYAECGGLMYLGESLIDQAGQQYPMSGIFQGYSTMTTSLKRFGYCQVTANQDVLIASQDEVIRGHEFHYSEFTTDLVPVFTCTKERDGQVLQRWQGGYQVKNTLASYLHVHFGQNPDLLLHWFQRGSVRQ
ncbi:cobyrinate a,c-diamide synthase [Vibrio gazogenes]|uniref:Cobyrinate a,c-diamide synthase n=1 Tax=Vibrio gazogenes DSM 21264 = NBRC 103151 TaxID=1123492 RepID=A0A1M4VLU4_VIBGA|nr:cobyrinate a,c-diamide synthase [Vibrio gazogenes]USP15514.1 cobyrinate a,c-diamide synthase [Vibrio gazogenes]SHE69812.1 cobyrinic acid a,c-diamide synthase [Vibrio gazogenes DSM 21264] [Vibrio gazogenes DSM 21264 = NBRC 103151]SJN57389.1 Cobyrinic acid A,C-diamide synthase [Vibrio gazogenes]